MSKIPLRVNSGLVHLLEAHEYAQDLAQSVWDFAVELPTLKRMGVTRTDFRWLVAKGLVEHAREITLAGEQVRAFRRSSCLTFSKRTCFVLTEAGVAFAREVSVPAAAHLQKPGEASEAGAEQAISTSLLRVSASPPSPKWDRDRQELRVGKYVVKQFKVPAANQEAILAAFEEENWPPRIDDPLSPNGEQDPKRRLHDTINSLNRNQKRSLIRFLGDGSGQGVRWELCLNRENGTVEPTLRASAAASASELAMLDETEDLPD